MKHRNHRHLKPLACAASAAVLAFAMSAPLPGALAAYATGAEAAGSAESATASSSAESSSSESSSSEASSEGSKTETGAASERGKAGESGEKGSGKAKDPKKGEKTAGPKASEKTASKAESAEKTAEDETGEDADEDKKGKDAEDSGKRKASGEDPAKYAKRLEGLASQLDAVPDEISEAKDIAGAYKKKLAKLSKKKTELEKEQQRAQNVYDEMESELSAGTDATLAMVITGKADFDSIDSRGYLLKKVADGSSARIAKIKKQLTSIDKERRKLKKREAAEMKAAVKNHKAEVEKAIEKGNAIAAKIEQNVSLMKYAEPSLSAGRAALRRTSLDAAAKWYEFEDAMAGNDDVLTFGTGAEFDLSEKAFVKKWGAAIDAFYEHDYPAAELKGHGEEMAQAAWDAKIDPRLCAAVSIIESTGGQYCIKPHNAWGWGAVDSDPYGGASGWDSWAGAIKAWHEGMAASTTGLATAPTVEELGEIYCSSLDWAAHVSQQMEKISAEAK